MCYDARTDPSRWCSCTALGDQTRRVTVTTRALLHRYGMQGTTTSISAWSLGCVTEQALRSALAVCTCTRGGAAYLAKQPKAIQRVVAVEAGVYYTLIPAVAGCLDLLCGLWTNSFQPDRVHHREELGKASCTFLDASSSHSQCESCLGETCLSPALPRPTYPPVAVLLSWIEWRWSLDCTAAAKTN